jgi:hypothetical protein
MDLSCCIFNMHAERVALEFQIKVVMNSLAIRNLETKHKDTILHEKVSFDSKTCSSIFAWG